MKHVFFIVSFLFIFSVSFSQSQVKDLPKGTYETYFYGFGGLTKWLRGDLILLSGTTYKLSDEKEVGNFRFDPVKQRVYFLSGPLKNVFAKTTTSSKKPAIILPIKENERFKLAVSDIYAYYKAK